VRGLGFTVGLGLLLVALLPGMARALELTGFDSTDEPKKLRQVFSFDEVVEAQIISNYAGNFVDIGIRELSIPQQLTQSDHPPASVESTLFFRFTRFSIIDGEGHIRLYLGKYADPADVQVVLLDDRIEVELVKPFWKVPEEALDTTEPVIDDAAAGDTGFIPDDAEDIADSDIGTENEFATFTWEPPGGLRGDTGTASPSIEETPAVVEGSEPVEDTTLLADIDFEDDGEVFEVDQPEEPADEPVDTAVDEDPLTADSGEEYISGGLDDLRRNTEVHEELDDTSPLPEEDAVASGSTENGDEETNAGSYEEPVHDVAPTPSYTRFNLDEVPVADVQLRNMPFNEALLELVASTGFNVIVGKGVSSETMTLDFRQKELSLKRALDLLSIAYDLTYTVEDDAIIVKGK
jgi:hypothetical protein